MFGTVNPCFPFFMNEISFNFSDLFIVMLRNQSLPTKQACGPVFDSVESQHGRKVLVWNMGRTIMLINTKKTSKYIQEINICMVLVCNVC